MTDYRLQTTDPLARFCACENATVRKVRVIDVPCGQAILTVKSLATDPEGCAQPHCAYLLADRRNNRMKVLAHDDLGIWLAARRLHQDRFIWPGPHQGFQLELSPEQLPNSGDRSSLVASWLRQNYPHALTEMADLPRIINRAQSPP